MDSRRMFNLFCTSVSDNDPLLSDHWHDVLVGSILGTTFAYFSYRQYYPSLASELSHRPYSPRIKREDDEALPTHQVRTNFDSQQQYPFAPPNVPMRYEEHNGSDYELDSTVLRPDPGPLEEVWKQRDSSINQDSGDDDGNRSPPLLKKSVGESSVTNPI